MGSPDRDHLPRLGEPPERAIFIVGLHRSGTTLLHRMLASAADVDVVTYYDVVEFPRLLDHRLRGGRDEAIAAIEARLRPLGGDRGIDRVPVGPFEPEEYGGVLRRSCVGLDGHHPHSNTDFGPLRLLLRKKRFLSDRARPLLLKNPIDAYDGVLRLDEAIPDASFVLLHRHPLPTFDSNLRAWRRVLEARNPWLEGLDRGYRALMAHPEVLERVRAACGGDTHLRAVRDRIRTGLLHMLEVERSLPRERTVGVRFEDLCTDPEGELTRVIEALGLERIGPSRESVEPPASREVDPRVERIHGESIGSWRTYLRRHRYPDRPE